MPKKPKSSQHKVHKLLNLPISTPVGVSVLVAAVLFIGATMVQAMTPQSVLFPLQSVLGDNKNVEEEDDQDKEEQAEAQKQEEERREEEEDRAEEERKAAENQAEEAKKAEERLKREQEEQKRQIDEARKRNEEQQAKGSEQMVQEIDGNDFDEEDFDDDFDEVEDNDESEDDGDNSYRIKINTQTKKSDGSEVKYTFELKEGKMVLKTKTKQAGSEVETESETELEQDSDGVDVLLAKQRLLIEADGDRLLFTHRNHVGSSHFPLRIDGVTGELIVITPNGEKIVTILPQQAVDNLLSKNFVLDEVSNDDSSDDPDSTDLADPVIAGSQLELESEDGQLVYKVKAKQQQRLLGLIPVEVEKEAVVSAETGQLVGETTLGWIDQILDIFAF